MKQYSSFNNNASLDMIRSKYQDELTCNSQTLHIIRSIVDGLYQTNNHESSSSTESKEKRVRFTLKQETESIKYQPMLSDSTTVACCLIKGRSKVDCSVSTNDLPSFQCECATQTIENNHSSMSLLTTDKDQLSVDVPRSKSILT
jgi:hypothetical protein